MLICFWSGIVSAQLRSIQSDIYFALIDNNAATWAQIDSKLSEVKPSQNDSDLLFRYALANLAYSAWLLESGQKNKVENQLENTEFNVELYISSHPKSGMAHVLMAGVYASKVGVHPGNILNFGGKILLSANQACKFAPNNPLAWWQRGNAYNLTPQNLGGNQSKAIEYYNTAIKLWNLNSEASNREWTYLSCQLALAKAYEKKGKLLDAKLIYEKILRKEPNFSLVRNKMYPALLKKMKAKSKPKTKPKSKQK